MPRIFLWRYAESPQSQKCCRDWADVCIALVEGKAVALGGVVVEAKGLQEKEMLLSDLNPVPVDDACSLMKEAATHFKIFTGQKTGNAVP